jgi:hypothetical protein
MTTTGNSEWPLTQPESPTPKLTSQQPVLVDQIRNRLPLPAVQPAGEHGQPDLQRCEGDHEAQLISPSRPERPRPGCGTLRSPSKSPERSH